MNLKKVVITILSVLLAAAGFFIIGKYMNEGNAIKDLNAYADGANEAFGGEVPSFKITDPLN